jgi:hypothetical protein
MLISVFYKNGECALVDADFLDQLIETEQIDKFLRLEGWVTVSDGPLRVMTESHQGIERRQDQPFSNVTNLHGFRLGPQKKESGYFRDH